MEDNAQGVTLAREQAADPVAHVGTVVAARARHRPVTGGEDDRLALIEMHDAAPRLGPRPLLDEQELAALEILARLAQEHGELDGKDHVAVEILVQAVVAAGFVAQEQRRGLGLAATGTQGEERAEIRGMAHPRLERGLPAIRHGGERRVRVLAHLPDEVREGIGEVLILPHPEAEARHVHPAPEAGLGAEESPELRAFGRRQESGGARISPFVEGGADSRPVQPGQPVGNRRAHAA